MYTTIFYSSFVELLDFCFFLGYYEWCCMAYRCLFRKLISFPLDTYPVVGLLGNIVVLLNLKPLMLLILFSTMASLIFIPPKQCQMPCFSPETGQHFLGFLVEGIHSRMRWYDMVLLI